MIQFSTQDTGYSLKNKLKIRRWIQTIIREEGGKPGNLSYIFCSDNYLFQLNRKYLRHHTLTDILSFDYSEEGVVSGDILISVERVQENAKTFSRSFDEELGRVMSHGVLHLLGYKDKLDEDKSKMTKKENLYLASFPNL